MAHMHTFYVRVSQKMPTNQRVVRMYIVLNNRNHCRTMHGYVICFLLSLCLPPCSQTCLFISPESTKLPCNSIANSQTISIQQRIIMANNGGKQLGLVWVYVHASRAKRRYPPLATNLAKGFCFRHIDPIFSHHPGGPVQWKDLLSINQHAC